MPEKRYEWRKPGPHNHWALGRPAKTMIEKGVYADTITHVIPEQGCVIVTASDPEGFPPPVWAADDGPSAYDTWEESAKVELWSSDIWWWRKKEWEPEV